MQFFEWETQYQKAKKELKPLNQWRPCAIDAWYKGILQEYLRRGSTLAAADPRPANTVLGMSAELWCYEASQPYYKVYPHMASVMSDVSIDIPVSELHVPYRAFTIHLANDDQNDFQEGGRRLRSLLISQVLVDNTKDNTGFKMPTLQDTASYGRGLMFCEAPLRLATGADRAFRVGYEFTCLPGEFNNQFDYSMSLHANDNTLEKEFQTSWDFSIDDARATMEDIEPGAWVPSKAIIERIMRLAVATCFFGIDQHEVVMPDLQRKIVEKRQSQRLCSFEEAYHEVAREQRDGARHWTIGREISLPRPLTESTNGSTEEGKGWTHASMRRGHMRWQPCGEGRKQRKLTFVHPHVCRPDLPWQRAPGFKIPDTNLETK